MKYNFFMKLRFQEKYLPNVYIHDYIFNIFNIFIIYLLYCNLLLLFIFIMLYNHQYIINKIKY